MKIPKSSSDYFESQSTHQEIIETMNLNYLVLLTPAILKLQFESHNFHNFEWPVIILSYIFIFIIMNGWFLIFIKIMQFSGYEILFLTQLFLPISVHPIRLVVEATRTDFCLPILSARYTVIGKLTKPNIIYNASSQTMSFCVIFIGLSSSRSIGTVGADHPICMPSERALRVPGKQKKCVSHTYIAKISDICKMILFVGPLWRIFEARKCNSLWWGVFTPQN